MKTPHIAALSAALLTCAGAASLVRAAADDAAAPPRSLSFEERCADPLVVLCDPLDSAPVRGEGIRPTTRNRTLPEALNGKYGDWRWCTHDPKRLPRPPVLDRKTLSSGTGALRLTVTGGGQADGAGYCVMNFTPDNSVQFGEGDTFFVQFKVRYDCALLFTECDPDSPAYKRQRRKYQTVAGGVTALKISILNTGDHPLLEQPTGSCSNQHLVLIVDARGVVQGYHSCDWFDHHRGDLGLDKRTGGGMFDLQPRKSNTGRFARHCHQSGSPGARRDDPTADCFLMPADEWVTITQQVSVGLWSNSVYDPLRSSNVKVWMAREGEAPQLVIDYDRNLMRPEKPFMKYGKVWLVPYITDKSPKDLHPDGSVWYDELIVSRGPIAPAR